MKKKQYGSSTKKRAPGSMPAGSSCSPSTSKSTITSAEYAATDSKPRPVPKPSFSADSAAATVAATASSFPKVKFQYGSSAKKRTFPMPTNSIVLPEKSVSTPISADYAEDSTPRPVPHPTFSGSTVAAAPSVPEVSLMFNRLGTEVDRGSRKEEEIVVWSMTPNSGVGCRKLKATPTMKNNESRRLTFDDPNKSLQIVNDFEKTKKISTPSIKSTTKNHDKLSPQEPPRPISIPKQKKPIPSVPELSIYETKPGVSTKFNQISKGEKKKNSQSNQRNLSIESPQNKSNATKNQPDHLLLKTDKERRTVIEYETPQAKYRSYYDPKTGKASPYETVSTANKSTQVYETMLNDTPTTNQRIKCDCGGVSTIIRKTLDIQADEKMNTEQILTAIEQIRILATHIAKFRILKPNDEASLRLEENENHPIKSVSDFESCPSNCLEGAGIVQNIDQSTNQSNSTSTVATTTTTTVLNDLKRSQQSILYPVIPSEPIDFSDIILPKALQQTQITKPSLNDRSLLVKNLAAKYIPNWEDKYKPGLSGTGCTNLLQHQSSVNFMISSSPSSPNNSDPPPPPPPLPSVQFQNSSAITLNRDDEQFLLQLRQDRPNFSADDQIISLDNWNEKHTNT